MTFITTILPDMKFSRLREKIDPEKITTWPCQNKIIFIISVFDLI